MDVLLCFILLYFVHHSGLVASICLFFFLLIFSSYFQSTQGAKKIEFIFWMPTLARTNRGFESKMHLQYSGNVLPEKSESMHLHRYLATTSTSLQIAWMSLIYSFEKAKNYLHLSWGIFLLPQNLLRGFGNTSNIFYNSYWYQRMNTLICSFALHKTK